MSKPKFVCDNSKCHLHRDFAGRADDFQVFLNHPGEFALQFRSFTNEELGLVNRYGFRVAGGDRVAYFCYDCAKQADKQFGYERLPWP